MTYVRDRSEDARRWHELNAVQNIGLSQIAAREGVSRNVVIGAVFRYRLRHGLVAPPQKRAKGDKAAKAVSRPRAVYAPPSAPFVPTQTLPTFLDVLTKNTCRYIGGDPLSADAVYCGHERVGGRMWCAGHLPRVFTRLKQQGGAP